MQDQFQAGEFPGGGQDLGGVGPLPSALFDHSCVTYPVQGQGQELVGAVVLAQAVAEVREHAVVETGVVQVHGQGVREVDPAPHRLGRLPVGEAEQELQYADRGQLGRRKPGASVAWIPGQEVLVAPQPVEVITYPHRGGPTRITRPSRPSRELRHDRTGPRANGH